MQLYVEVNQNGRDDKLNLNEIFFFLEENGLEINLECFYTAFIQSKFKILDDLSSLKKIFFRKIQGYGSGNFP